MKIRANGILFHTKIDGPDNAPWLIFSNSLATNLHMWDDQVAVLKDTHRILRYDQRGHDGTDAPEGAYDFETLSADVIALMDEIGIAKADFCGLSMGGITAQALGQKYPARFSKLVMCDCPAASTPASAQQWAERIQLAKEKGMDALVDITAERWFPPEVVAMKPPGYEKIRQMIRTTPVNGFIGCAGALSNFDFKAGLGDIKAPVLLMSGSRDAALPGVKFLAGAIAGSKMVELEGAGHISNIEQPEVFTEALRDFLG
jgi:3-oxoadipate enol-lactonase